ncbi:hypothetical protein UlMin_032248 [Ulmus minor]
MERLQLPRENNKMYFFGETVSTAAFLVNRSPSGALDLKIPEEIWSGKPLELGNLRTFGYAAFAHQNDDKLNPRSRKCVFLGYGEGVNGYKLWSLEPKGTKLIISRNVIFNEQLFPYLEKTNPARESEQTSSTDVEHSIKDDSVQVE